MVLPALAGGFGTGLGTSIGGALGGLFGSDEPSLTDILKKYAEIGDQYATQGIEDIYDQTNRINSATQGFLDQYMSDATRNSFGRNAKSTARGLSRMAGRGDISFAEAQNRFMDSASSAGIRPGDTMGNNMTLADYGRQFDRAERKTAPDVWARGMNTNAMELLGRSLTPEEKKVYKYGSMSDTQARSIMGSTFEVVSRNPQSTMDAEAAWRFGGRTVYPTAESRNDPAEMERQMKRINEGLMA